MKALRKLLIEIITVSYRNWRKSYGQIMRISLSRKSLCGFKNLNAIGWIWEIAKLHFFHACTMIRCQRNKIGMWKDANGNWVQEEETLKCMAVGFFKLLYSNDDNNQTLLPLTSCFLTLDDYDLDIIYRLVDDLEVKETSAWVCLKL